MFERDRRARPPLEDGAVELRAARGERRGPGARVTVTVIWREAKLLVAVRVRLAEEPEWRSRRGCGIGFPPLVHEVPIEFWVQLGKT